MFDATAYCISGITMYPAVPSEQYGAGGTEVFNGVDPKTKKLSLWELMMTAIATAQVDNFPCVNGKIANASPL